jgi:deaminated glutathione amidase
MVAIAAIQMTTGADVARNLADAWRLLREARAKDAEIAALPENFALMGHTEREKLAIAEQPGDGPIQRFLAQAAREFRMWLVAGTIPIATAEPAKVAAACLVLDPDGRTVARYDKIHLFDVNIPGRDERYMESGTVLRGGEPVCVDTPAGRLGLAVCYDVRFPELFRDLGRAGADWFCLPSAFTAPTGRAHWEVLLRARAIENLACMVAPAQSGFHENGRETYGDTMIVDCWGRVQSRLPRGTGVVIGRIDLVRQREVRQNFPVLTHRRPA